MSQDHADRRVQNQDRKSSLLIIKTTLLEVHTHTHIYVATTVSWEGCEVAQYGFSVSAGIWYPLERCSRRRAKTATIGRQIETHTQRRRTSPLPSDTRLRLSTGRLLSVSVSQIAQQHDNGAGVFEFVRLPGCPFIYH